ncbi:MAG: hypothetical protein FWB93_02705 [Oscillospiraceae bacterium]|nr:hypothetical protein [Oscillospiraceae bacterium]
MKITTITYADNLRHAGRIMLSYNFAIPQTEECERFNTHYAAIGEAYESFVLGLLSAITAEYDEMQAAGLRTRFVPLKISGEYVVRRGLEGRFSVSFRVAHTKGRRVTDFAYVTHTWTADGLILPPKRTGKPPRGKWDGCWVEGERVRYYRNTFDKNSEHILRGADFSQFVEVL